jgi:hypothetical protein
VTKDVLEDLICDMPKFSMLVAVSVQWTQEGSSMFIQPPDTYRKDVLLNVPAKQTVQSLHQLAFTIINLLSYVALNTSNCSVSHSLYLGIMSCIHLHLNSHWNFTYL